MWDAAKKGRLEEVQLVCEFFPERVNKRDQVRSPQARPHAMPLVLLALHAAAAGMCCCIAVVAAHGVGVQYSQTALSWASCHGQLAVVEALLAARADANARNNVQPLCVGV